MYMCLSLSILNSRQLKIQNNEQIQEIKLIKKDNNVKKDINEFVVIESL